MSSRIEQSEVDKQFAESIKSARNFLGWNQSIVADKMRAAGFSHYYQTTVCRNEADGRTIPLGEAITLASILGVTIEGSPGLSYADGYKAGINAACESLAALNK